MGFVAPTLVPMKVDNLLCPFKLNIEHHVNSTFILLELIIMKFKTAKRVIAKC